MTDTTGNTSYDSVKTGSDDDYCKKVKKLPNKLCNSFPVLKKCNSFEVLTLKKSPAKCGMYTFNDGSRYIGDFDNDGVKCGKGHMEAPNGSTYEGQFQKGLPNGLGVMRFPDSSRYEGEFMQGWFHGHGIYTTIDGTKFEGKP